MSALFNKITSAFAKQPTSPEEMSTEMLLQSMGIGAGAAAAAGAAAEEEQPQHQQRHQQQPAPPLAVHVQQQHHHQPVQQLQQQQQQQFESDSVAALFKAASLGQMGGQQMPSTSYGEPETVVAMPVPQVPAAGPSTPPSTLCTGYTMIKQSRDKTV